MRLWLLVTGSREWTDRVLLGVTLRGYRERYRGDVTLIEGCNPRGADRMAEEFADDKGLQVQHFPARWNEYAPEDRWRAGHDRNREMLDFLLACEGDRRVVAFKDGLRPALDKGGTENMLRITLEAIDAGAEIGTHVVSHPPALNSATPSLW